MGGSSFLFRLVLWGLSFFLRWLLVPLCLAIVIALNPPTLGELTSNLVLFICGKLHGPKSKQELRLFRVHAINLWGWRVEGLEATVLETKGNGAVEAVVLLVRCMEVRSMIKV
jgi:hypothetical protein